VKNKVYGVFLHGRQIIEESHVSEFLGFSQWDPEDWYFVYKSKEQLKSETVSPLISVSSAKTGLYALSLHKV